jgi:hypothetical protein
VAGRLRHGDTHSGSGSVSGCLGETCLAGGAFTFSLSERGACAAVSPAATRPAYVLVTSSRHAAVRFRSFRRAQSSPLRRDLNWRGACFSRSLGLVLSVSLAAGCDRRLAGVLAASTASGDGGTDARTRGHDRGSRPGASTPRCGHATAHTLGSSPHPPMHHKRTHPAL